MRELLKRDQLNKTNSVLTETILQANFFSSYLRAGFRWFSKISQLDSEMIQKFYEFDELNSLSHNLRLTRPIGGRERGVFNQRYDKPISLIKDKSS